MTNEKAIEVLSSWAECNYKPTRDAARMAIAALRAQAEAEQVCDKCSGIVYRQTASGKIIPLEQQCGAKITPPCYQPDGDGCAYPIYGDNNDEPIERCKECPLCHSDKIRHHQEKNEPLTLEELREMDGETVCIAPVDGGPYTWMLVDTKYEVCREAHGGLAVFENFGKTWVAYRRKPEDGRH